MRLLRRSVPFALLTLFLLVPASASALPRGFFGIAPQTGLTDRDTARMRAGGVETIRIPVEWRSVQPSAASDFQWGGLDAAVALAARDRLEVLPVLYGTPRWLSHDARRLPVASGRQRRAWSEFVSAAVERYGRSGEFWQEHGPGSDEPLPLVPIRSWQIWNEENFFYFTRPASPGRYARLLKISKRAIHRADPRGELIIGGLFGDPKGRPPLAMDAADFLDSLYRVRGVKATFDGIALHPYAADVGVLASLVNELRAVALRHHDRRAGLYVTELGWGSQYDPRRVAFEVGLRGQARELRAAYRFLIANRHRLNLRQVDWFSWKDVGGSCGFCDSVGLFRRGDRFRPKPAWHAFVNLARRR